MHGVLPMAHAQSACCMLLEAAHLTCLQDGLGDFFGLHKSSNCLQLRAKNALVSGLSLAMVQLTLLQYACTDCQQWCLGCA